MINRWQKPTMSLKYQVNNLNPSKFVKFASVRLGINDINLIFHHHIGGR